ncbi:MAG: hypothetical protein L0Y54_11640, partial [Sporichthyaceae bacterium]|nr:hypothetical protein [Sporichthyaceae bacterium]
MTDGLTRTGRARTVTVPHDARGARIARQRLARELGGRIPQTLLADTVAVVAELLGNAVCHAAPLSGGVIRLWWFIGADGGAPAAVGSNGHGSGAGQGTVFVRIRVTDGGSTTLPARRDAEPDAVGGRGL